MMPSSDIASNVWLQCRLGLRSKAPVSGLSDKVFSGKGGIMCRYVVAVWVTGFILAAAGSFTGPAHAQQDSARPAVQDLASKPIGKIVVATGSITLERASAAVVQA